MMVSYCLKVSQSVCREVALGTTIAPPLPRLLLLISRPAQPFQTLLHMGDGPTALQGTCYSVGIWES